MKERFAILCLCLVLSPSIHALPRYALITGARCGSCHVNPTGGQMRTAYGIDFSQNALPMRILKDSAAAENAAPDSSVRTGSEPAFNSRLTDNISIGGDFRVQFIDDQGSKTTSFQAMTMELYGAVQLNKKALLYVKQDIVNPQYALFSGPEVFGVIKPKASFYVKGGIFLPDYGIRVDDHTQYTRGGDIGFITSLGLHQGLLFVPNYKDIGVEAGLYHGGLFVTGGVFNGTGNSRPIDFSQDKAYAGKAEFMGNFDEGTHFRIGASVYGFQNFHMTGVHAGIGIENAALFGEVDWTRNRFDILGANTVITGIQSMASFAELDYRLLEGAWLTGRFDMFDPQLGLEDDQAGSLDNSVQRFTFGAEIFPCSFVEIRPQYRLNVETPAISNNQMLVQLHYWY